MNNTVWITCPHCGKRIMPVSSGAQIRGQLIKCKRSWCGAIFTVNTDTGSGIKIFREK